MKNFLLSLSCLGILSLSSTGYCQNHILRGISVIDSTTFTFEATDSLTHYFLSPAIVSIDTIGAQLWQIGNTGKPFFALGDTTRSIMTDTLNSYPVNANDWFTLSIPYYELNPIVYFKHKFQTTAGRDGGIVEFSFDGGTDWQNVLGDCNADSFVGGEGIHTDNFYGKNDTLANGEQAFSGTSNGWQVSGVQFFAGFPVKPKNTSSCTPNDTILLRFRFVSDSVADTLDGWIISEVTVVQDYYGSKVNDVVTSQLKVFPNPVNNSIINFPELPNEQKRQIYIYNAVGKLIMERPYQHRIDLRNNAAGLYFYRVSGNDENYKGRIMIE